MLLSNHHCYPVKSEIRKVRWADLKERGAAPALDGRDGDLERQRRPRGRRGLARAPRVDRLLQRGQPLTLRVLVGGDQSVSGLQDQEEVVVFNARTEKGAFGDSPVGGWRRAALSAAAAVAAAEAPPARCRC